jgi:gliding motility-associated-like protein
MSYLKKILLVVVFIFQLQLNVCASHMAGAEITYEWLGTNTYLITLKLYRDASGIPAPVSANVCFSSQSFAFSSTLPLQPISGTGTQVIFSGCTSLQAGSNYVIEEYIYQGAVVLPQQAADWKFEFYECCRNAAFCPTTIANANGVYVSTTLNNLLFPDNSSVQFNLPPIAEMCVNLPYTFIQGASDPNSDSLTFELVAAEDALAACPYTPVTVIYNPPYSGTYPFPTANGIVNCNLNTGNISFTPTNCCPAIICVLIKEWDRATGLLKGTVKRDMQLNTSCSCNAMPPIINSQLTNTSITINSACTDTTFFIVFNDTTPIVCQSIVPSDIRFKDANGMSNPVVNAQGYNCTNGLTDSILVTVLNPITAGVNTIVIKTGFDGNTFLTPCGMQLTELQDTILINVADNSTLTSIADTIDCTIDSLLLTFNQKVNCYSVAANGSDFQLNDILGNVYTITSATCANHYSNTVVLYTVPNTTVSDKLIVTIKTGTDLNTISNTCNSFLMPGDTISTIQRHINNAVFAGNDTSYCIGSVMSDLNATAVGVLNWQWYLNGMPIGGANNNYFTPTDSGSYVVNANYGYNCHATDTVAVSFYPTPVVIITDSLGNTSGFESCLPQGPFELLYANSNVVGNYYQWILPDNSWQTDSIIAANLPGDYLLSITTVNGCVATDNAEVNSINCGFRVYNVITPNGDGLNDFFTIQNLDESSSASVKIYNSWGLEVFADPSYKNNWSANTLSAGSYFYLVDILNGNNVQEYKGSLVVLKPY